MIPEPFVSIVVPVFNSEKYLKDCVESLLKQSFTDFEIILVDDGSTDRSSQMCDEFASHSERISVIHKANGGVSSARNVGINEAKGKWITFVDSDDELYSDALDLLVRNSVGTDIVIAETDENYKGLSKYYLNENDNIEEWSLRDFALELFHPKNNIYKGFTHAKLFKTDILRDFKILFNEKILYNEDRLFSLEYVVKSGGKIKYLPKKIYNYKVRDEGAMQKMQRDEFETDLDATILMRHLLIPIQNKSIKFWLTENGIVSWITNYKIKDKENIKKKRKRLNKKLREFDTFYVILGFAYLLFSKFSKKSLAH